MPLFEFRCERCGNTVERICANAESADAHSVWCDAHDCKPVVPGGVCRMVRIMSVSNFSLKGSGFHVNDYARKS